MSEQYFSRNLTDLRPIPFPEAVFSEPHRKATPGHGCIHQIFEEQARQQPHARAVFLDSQSLSYTELNTRANQVARYLRQRGVGRDVLVGVCMERSIGALVALLAILKCGGAYVPLDPAYPKDRIAFILADARCHLLITNRELLGCLPPGAPDLVLIDECWPAIAHFSGENLEPCRGRTF